VRTRGDSRTGTLGYVEQGFEVIDGCRRRALSGEGEQNACGRAAGDPRRSAKARIAQRERPEEEMNISHEDSRPVGDDGAAVGSAVVAGVLAYGDIPIAALPQVRHTPTTRHAVLPGAAPGDGLFTVATKLEKQFANLQPNVINRRPAGRTKITLDFAQDRDIDKARWDVAGRVFRASRNLPIERRDAVYRKVNRPMRRSCRQLIRRRCRSPT